VERAREETRPIEDQWAGEYSAFSDGLLVDELREFARESIPTSVAGLARAASVSFEDSELATAFADLCVTGRNAFERFRTERPTVERIVEELRSIRAGTDEDLEAAAEWALHRTLVVANALRTGVGRESLGWIAVCGDEDPPHRPVNVPVTEYPQFDLDVRVEPIALRNQTVRTRAMIAIGEPTEIEPPASDTLGDDPTPTIDPDVPLILFLHGHSSRLEEAESLIRPFVRRGFGVVAMDLPSSGYSESIPHDRIEEEIPEPLITDNPPRYFALEFLDAFVHAFINALSDAVGFDISRQIVLVIGGSLGGNLSLRLASASPFNKPYAANVSAWSPASVWTPSDDNFWRNLGPKTSAERAWEHEDESTRESYFYYTFFAANPAFDLRPQGEYWYRDGWEPCKSLHITGAIADRQEIYNESFRRWHWRVAMEQLWFSHNEPAFRRHNILGRTLLSAGEKDNYNWSHIHNATQTLAIRLLNAPGKFYSIEDTGHSIHVERPEFFAREMALFAPPLYPGDETETWSAPVSLGGVSNSDPVAVKQENGRLVVFSINASNRVQFAVQADSGFGSWSTISGGLGSGDSFLAPFDVAINHGGHLEVFATLSNEPWLAHVWQDGANGPWRDWEKGNHVSQLIGSATSGVRVAERVGHGDGPERLLLACARLTDGRVHVRGQNVLDSWWMNGKNLGEDSVTLIGRPCIAANKRQLLHLFIRDSSNSIQHIWEEAQDNWADSWTAMFSATSDPVCAIDATGRLHVFARGDTGDLTLQSEASTGSRSIRGDWTSAPISLGGTIAAGTSPAVARNAWGQLQVFATFDDRTIWTRRQLSGDSSVWSEWFDTGLITNGNPTVVSNLDGTLSVFALATDGSITWARQENPYVEPALERLITGVTKNEDDEIIAVCNPGEPWSPLSTAEVVRDILSGAHVYFTEVDGIRANVHVVEGRYLRSNPDGTTINNLDELPEC
jgi:pimeloyl-ACP methyl ester carboxylesterase